MNLVLFEPDELTRPLSRTDRRAQHVITVLRRSVGDSFDAAVINGARGKATITAITAETVSISFQPLHDPVPPLPVTVIVGLPRPQTARDILRDATTLGAAALHFVRTERGESSYAQSTLWSSGEWRRHVLAGAEQAFDPHVPNVTFGRTLVEVMTPTPTGIRLALDNYESAAPLAAVPIPPGVPITLVIGSERGWSAGERDTLRAHGFTLAHLGSRVLRTETAVIAALTLVHAKLSSSDF